MSVIEQMMRAKRLIDGVCKEFECMKKVDVLFHPHDLSFSIYNEEDIDWEDCKVHVGHFGTVFRVSNDLPLSLAKELDERIKELQWKSL